MANHLKIQTQYPHAWGYIHVPSPDKCTTAWKQKSCCTQRIACLAGILHPSKESPSTFALGYGTQNSARRYNPSAQRFHLLFDAKDQNLENNNAIQNMPLVRCGSSAKRACNHIGTDNRLPLWQCAVRVRHKPGKGRLPVSRPLPTPAAHPPVAFPL